MSKHQRVIVAIGLVFIVGLGLWPPFQYRGQYEGQHFLFDPAYDSARIDVARLCIAWLLIVLIFAIILLLYKIFSLRVVKIFGLTVAALVLIAATLVLVVKSVRRETRRQAYAALTQQARYDLAAVKITSPSETHFVIANPTKWELSGSSFTVDYLTVGRMTLFSDKPPSSSLRSNSQETYKKDPVSRLSSGQQSQLPQKSPFIQRLTVKYNRAAFGDQTVELDPPFELVSERYFVFYPEEWGWDKVTQTSLHGPAEFKEVSSSTQSAPPRRLAGPPSFSDFLR